MPATTTLPAEVPVGYIRLYIVGIYFYRDLLFAHDAERNGIKYISGGKILAEAHAAGLQWTVNEVGHLESVSYTPRDGDPVRKHPSNPTNFPYFGTTLTLKENLLGRGAISQILQFTSDSKVSVPSKGGLSDTLQADAQFVPTGFVDRSFIRVRQLGIYRQV